MNTIIIPQDISTMVVPAATFPAGIAAAWQQLHHITGTDNRVFYGISHGSPAGIVYYAATAERHAGEAAGHVLGTWVIRKGTYAACDIHGYMDNAPAIGAFFQEVVVKGDIDPQGACIEWYLDLDVVRCMVKLMDTPPVQQ
ncbi:MAG: transcriptional regulator [Chitinophagia bacterium]|nr:transcriptional regulator [Chitinophagia bacterium]